LRRRSAAVLALLTVVAIAWNAALSDAPQARLSDFARLSELERSRTVLAPLAALWSDFCSSAWRMQAVEALVQLAAVGVVAWAVRTRSASTAATAIAGILLAVSSLPAHWLGRPLGILDCIALLALAFVFAELGGRMHRAALLATCIATAAGGWPFIPLLAVAAVRRDRAALQALGAGVIGLFFRVLAGTPQPAELFGVNPSADAVLRGVKLLIAAAVLAPAVVFALTRAHVRSALNRWIAAAQADAPLVAAALVLLVSAAVLQQRALAVFAAESAALIGFAPIGGVLAKRFSGVRYGVVALAAAIACAGFAVRVIPHPADDALRIAHDRRVLRAPVTGNGSPVIVVDHGNAALRERYPAYVLSYLAGRPLDVRYAETVPATGDAVVFDAQAGGIERVDRNLKALRALSAARCTVRFDFLAHAGTINQDVHVETPSGKGVIPNWEVATPAGPLSTLTVLSPFTYRFERVPVRRGDRLVYAVAKAMPSGNAMRGSVRIEIPGRPARVVDDELQPADPTLGSREWHYRSIPLDVQRDTTVRVVFAALTTTSQNLGDWAAFGSPAVVGDSPGACRAERTG
jgi:hypothetical protein